MKESNTWNEWSKHVLCELKRFDHDHDKIRDMISNFQERVDEKFNRLHLDVVSLKVKSSTWGAIAGAIGGSVISAIASFLISKK